MSRIRSAEILYALANYFDWFRNKMMPECYVDGGIADLIFITRAGYLTEVEIKISRADWHADTAKDKWKKPRPNVSRFFYAVPSTLAANIPSWVSAEAGILSVTGTDVREVRAAKRSKSKPLTDKELLHIYESCYYRFWTGELRRIREAMYKDAQRKLAA